jgi:hypothetical protein
VKFWSNRLLSFTAQLANCRLKRGRGGPQPLSSLTFFLETIEPGPRS